MKESNGVIELSTAAEMLGVSKRRMYDITNVLEGVDLVSKHSKNKIQWNSLVPLDYKSHIDNSNKNNKESNSHKEVELKLDEEIQEYKEKIHNLINTVPHYSYITNDDLEELDLLNDHRIIVVKAPYGTQLEVYTSNDVNDKFICEMVITNHEGLQIDAYLLSEKENATNNNDDTFPFEPEDSLQNYLNMYDGGISDYF